jgi:hypothetical protein
MNTVKQHKTETPVSITKEYIFVLTAALVLYTATCAPAILWQDSGLYVYRILTNDMQGNLGLALSHPLYFIIAIGVKHLNIGDLAWRINMLSAFFGAIAIANLFLILRLWLNKIVPAIISAITLAVSWTFWQHAVIAETDTLTISLILLEILLLLLYCKTNKIKYIYLLSLANGLAFANHMLAILSLVCYLVFICVLLARKEMKFKTLCVTAAIWIIAAAPYEFLIIRQLIETADFTATMKSAAFGDIWQKQVLNTTINKKIIFENIAFIGYTFPTPNILLFIPGLLVLWKKSPRKSFANILFALLVIYFIFAFRYTIPSRFSFFLPFYCIFAIIISLGADSLINRFNRKYITSAIIILAFIPIIIYSVAPALARNHYKALGQRRQRPYRDEYKYFLQPWKNNCTGAQRFAREALEAVEQNAIIYAYTTDVHALLYIQEYNQIRPDVMLVSDFDSGKNAPEFNQSTIEHLIKEHTVYVNSPFRGYCPAFILENYDFTKESVLWRVIKPDKSELNSQ